ncbi:MAG: MarR family winged helix-turn-helix transcriptional regulator [Saprospiraceae bacterium]
MKIEQAINQTKPFTTAYEKLIVNMIYTSTWLAARQKELLARYSLTMKQYNILRILRGAGTPISTAEIRKRMLDKMSDASRIVDRLEKKDFVIKRVCSEDHRKVDILITDKSLEVLKQIDRVMPSWQASLLDVSYDEAEQLSDLLDKLRGG